MSVRYCLYKHFTWCKVCLCVILACFYVILSGKIVAGSTFLEGFCEEKLSKGHDAIIEIYGKLIPCSIYLKNQKAERERLEREQLKRERFEQDRIKREQIKRERLKQKQLEQKRRKQEQIKRKRLEEKQRKRKELEREQRKRKGLELEQRKREQLERERNQKIWWWLKIVLLSIILLGTPVGLLKALQNWGRAFKANIKK